MKLKFNFKFIISFLALTFMMHEAHEIVHTTVGRIICGCWGERDFNVWGVCESCETNPYHLIATFVGPLFTFIMIWIGTNLLQENNTNGQKSLGFALIFANMPFARLLNPILGGGDEATVLNYFLKDRNLSCIITAIIVTLIIAFPLYRAFRCISNKYRILLFILFLLGPTIIDLLLVLGLMNTLLEKGVLSEYWILGSPILVTVWTFSVTLIFVVFGYLNLCRFQKKYLRTIKINQHTIMKKLLFILLLAAAQTVFPQTPTQDFEVLMIGASHSYDPKSPQDLTGIHAKIRTFKPNAIFGEWLSPEDEKALKNYWNKEGVMKRYERLKSRKAIPENELSKEIARYEAILDKNPKDMKARVDLAIAHYLSFDAGNGYFQMWHVGKHLQKNPKDTSVFNYARKIFLPASMDSVHKMVANYVDDEYDYIAHPMMLELGIKKMYAMDSQRWDDKWSIAWGTADSVFYAQRDKYKADSLSEMGKKVRDLRKLVKTRMDYLREDATKVYGENHATEALNGPQMTEWLYRINFVSDEYRQLDFFPADLYGWMLNYWWHRNNDMCDNTISRAKANGFKRVTIVVGANHAAIMSKIFKEKGIKVININDAPMK